MTFRPDPPFSQEKLRSYLTYDPVSGIFTRPDGKVAGGFDPAGYIKISVENYQYFAHRLAFFYMTGRWPRYVDHKDRVRSNNKWENLREATQSQNNVNAGAQKSNKSGYRGIHQISNGRFRVQLQKDGKPIHIGYFPDVDSAVSARDRAAVAVHKEFARISAGEV